MTNQRPWPPEQSAKGALRPWHDTAVGYLAVLFEDPEEAQRAQRGLQQQGVPEGDLRRYDGQETLRIAARLQQERSILAKAIKEIVVDHRAEQRWLGNASSILRQRPHRPGPLVFNAIHGRYLPSGFLSAAAAARSWSPACQDRRPQTGARRAGTTAAAARSGAWSNWSSSSSLSGAASSGGRPCWRRWRGDWEDWAERESGRRSASSQQGYRGVQIAPKS